jgi:hypothetical protein
MPIGFSGRPSGRFTCAVCTARESVAHGPDHRALAVFQVRAAGGLTQNEREGVEHSREAQLQQLGGARGRSKSADDRWAIPSVPVQITISASPSRQTTSQPAACARISSLPLTPPTACARASEATLVRPCVDAARRAGLILLDLLVVRPDPHRRAPRPVRPTHRQNRVVGKKPNATAPDLHNHRLPGFHNVVAHAHDAEVRVLRRRDAVEEAILPPVHAMATGG